MSYSLLCLAIDIRNLKLKFQFHHIRSSLEGCDKQGEICIFIDEYKMQRVLVKFFFNKHFEFHLIVLFTNIFTFAIIMQENTKVSDSLKTVTKQFFPCELFRIDISVNIMFSFVLK